MALRLIRLGDFRERACADIRAIIRSVLYRSSRLRGQSARLQVESMSLTTTALPPPFRPQCDASLSGMIGIKMDEGSSGALKTLIVAALKSFGLAIMMFRTKLCGLRSMSGNQV